MFAYAYKYISLSLSVRVYMCMCFPPIPRVQREGYKPETVGFRGAPLFEANFTKSPYDLYVLGLGFSSLNS